MLGDLARLQHAEGVDIGDVKRPVLSYPAGCWLINTYLDAPGRNGTELSPRNQHVSLAES